MTDAELLIECKKGLDIPVTSTAFDGNLSTKLLAVKGYMQGAGVSDTLLGSDLAVSVIIVGVGDLWNFGSGEVKFSPIFHTLLTQLAISSSVLRITSNPIHGAINVAANVAPTITFNKRITKYRVSIVNYNTSVIVPMDAALDITGKVLTITPKINLNSGTKYAIVVDYAKAYS
jgi:hypothetical protein